MKKPEECASIDEVRIEIDDIDAQIISLIGKRYSYVKQIVKFKKDAVDVKAQKRYDEVFEKRRKWAEKNNLDPNVIEEVYKILVHYFIDEQLKLLNKNKN